MWPVSERGVAVAIGQSRERFGNTVPRGDVNAKDSDRSKLREEVTIKNSDISRLRQEATVKDSTISLLHHEITVKHPNISGMHKEAIVKHPDIARLGQDLTRLVTGHGLGVPKRWSQQPGLERRHRTRCCWIATIPWTETSR